MELRQLKYFLSAARHLSFTEAAKECCVVQSAMSQQMRALEKELNVVLFERTKKGLVLTPEGAVLEREAGRLLDQVARMQDAVRQAGRDGESLMRVGCQGSLLRAALPRALNALRADHPGLRAQMTCGLRQALQDRLREGRLDCAVMFWKDGDESLAHRQVSEEVVCAALPAASPLAKAGEITREALKGCPLILCATEMDIPLLNARFSEFMSGFERIFVDSQSALEALVASKGGISLIAESAARPHPGIVYRPLNDLPPMRVSLVWPAHHPRTALIEAFASLLQMESSETIGVF